MVRGGFGLVVAELLVGFEVFLALGADVLDFAGLFGGFAGFEVFGDG